MFMCYFTSVSSYLSTCSLQLPAKLLRLVFSAADNHIFCCCSLCSFLCPAVANAGYVLPATAGTPAQQCEGSTYSPALNRLRACLPCQSGLAAPEGYNGTRDNRLDV
jgi:hypothetical protein